MLWKKNKLNLLESGGDNQNFNLKLMNYEERKMIRLRIFIYLKKCYRNAPTTKL